MRTKELYMKKMINYIRRNKVFVFLLSVIVMITAVLGIYYVTYIKKTDPQLPVINAPMEKEEKETAIASFQGSYDSEAKQVRLSWSLQQGEQKITSLKLLHDDNTVADVNALNSYVLNQDVYRFPGGENTFVLTGTLENGETIEKEARITIEYFSSIDCTAAESENGMMISLTYKYREGTDVQTPRIVANSLPYPYKFNFKETKKEKPVDGYVTATTVFEVDAREAESDEEVTIRWIFDSIGASYDFPITIIAKEAPVETEDE